MRTDNDPTKEKIEFARFIIDHNSSLINLGDTKAGILLGINGIILALLFGIEKNALENVARIFFILTGIALGVSSVYAVLTLIPRLTTESEKTRIYFTKVREYTREEYIKSWEAVPNGEILRDLLINIHNLAIIQGKKYKRLRYAILTNITGIGLLIIALCFYLAPDSAMNYTYAIIMGFRELVITIFFLIINQLM